MGHAPKSSSRSRSARRTRGWLACSAALVACALLSCDPIDAKNRWITNAVTPEPPPEPDRSSLPHPHLELQGNRLSYEGKTLRFGAPLRDWIAVLGEPVAGQSPGCRHLEARWPALGLLAYGHVPAAFFFKDSRKLCFVRDELDCLDGGEGERFLAWRRELLPRVIVSAMVLDFGPLPDDVNYVTEAPVTQWRTPPVVRFPGTFFLSGVGLSGGPQSLDQLMWRLERAPREQRLESGGWSGSATFTEPEPYFLDVFTSTAFAGPLAPVDVLRRQSRWTPLPPRYGSWFSELRLFANDFTPDGSFSRQLYEARKKRK